MLKGKPLFGYVLLMAEGKEQESSWKLVMGYVVSTHIAHYSASLEKVAAICDSYRRRRVNDYEQ